MVHNDRGSAQVRIILQTSAAQIINQSSPLAADISGGADLVTRGFVRLDLCRGLTKERNYRNSMSYFSDLLALPFAVINWFNFQLNGD